MKIKTMNNKDGKEKIMNTIRRLVAVLFSITMLIGTGITALAVVDPTYTIAVENETSGYTYNAYQIFTGDLSGGVLSNIKWGSGISEAGRNALYTRYNLTANDDKKPEKVAEKIAENNNAAEADAIATLLAKTTAGGLDTSIPMQYSESITVGSETFKGYAATEQVAGWYLIVNTGVPASVGDATYSDYIVEVFDNVKVSPKSGKPGSEKHVNDINDSDTTNHSELKDSADHDIGDHIPYTLTATLPSDYANYDTYYIQFKDDMSAGLTLDTSSVKIFYGNSDTTGASISFTQTEETSTFTNGKVYSYTIENVKATAPTLTAGAVIKITYTATLNKDAVIGSAGNPNQYKIVFSNNPNNSGTGRTTGDTPWDKNIVFTYKTVFKKVDENNKPLAGADFKLEKFIQNASGTAEYNSVKGDWTDVTTIGSNENHPTKTVENLTIGNDTATNAKFTFSGLDDGVYRLTETTTPATYNTIDPITFTITAEHVLVSDDPTLTSLTGNAGAEFTMTSNVSDGSLTTDIINKKGNTLPSTGGIGTTVFYVIGGVLVAGAAVMLIAKNKMSKN